MVDVDAPQRAPLKKSAAVRAGQRLFAARPLPDPDAVPPEPRVLYTDDELLVLDKPAGLATHPTASRFVATVTHWLARRTPPGEPRPEPAHRLDVETSGVLLAAKHPGAARWLKAAFAAGAVEKIYLAVVEGVPAARAWTCAIPLGFAGGTVRIKVGPGAWPAVTDFRVVWDDGRRAAVEAVPRTGRQHQIRAHLAMCGHPVVGDKLYGADEGLFLASLERELTEEEVARLGCGRHALHAWRVRLRRPDGGEVWFEAPWPEDLRGLVERRWGDGSGG